MVAGAECPKSPCPYCQRGSTPESQSRCVETRLTLRQAYVDRDYRGRRCTNFRATLFHNSHIALACQTETKQDLSRPKRSLFWPRQGRMRRRSRMQREGQSSPTLIASNEDTDSSAPRRATIQMNAAYCGIPVSAGKEARSMRIEAAHRLPGGQHGDGPLVRAFLAADTRNFRAKAPAWVWRANVQLATPEQSPSSSVVGVSLASVKFLITRSEAALFSAPSVSPPPSCADWLCDHLSRAAGRSSPWPPALRQLPGHPQSTLPAADLWFCHHHFVDRPLHPGRRGPATGTVARAA